MSDPLLTLQDLAEQLHCSVDTVRRILKRRKVKVVRLSQRTVRIRQSEFLSLLSRSEKTKQMKFAL